MEKVLCSEQMFSSPKETAVKCRPDMRLDDCWYYILHIRSLYSVIKWIRSLLAPLSDDLAVLTRPNIGQS